MVTGYSRLQIALHWAVALLILFNLIFSDPMSALWRQIEQTGPMPVTSGALAHILVGASVLVLALWRLGLRHSRGVPAAPPGESLLMARAATAGHILIYVLMLALPITGLLAFYGGLPALAELHEGPLKALMWLMIVLHVLAAFYHHFVLKDGLLNRMRKPG